MLFSFLDKLSGFLDRRFIVGYWAPTAIVVVLAALGAAAGRPGIAVAWTQWVALSATLQTLILASALIVVTVMAYMLQAISLSIIRLAEGYWPPVLDRFARRARANQLRAKHRMEGRADMSDRQAAMEGLHQAGSYRRRYLNFPRNDNLVRPTTFGNTMTAAEEHAYQLYRLDSILWWPRLAPLLPDPLSSQVDAAFTPLAAMINLSAGLIGLALTGGIYFAAVDRHTALFVACFGGGLLLARVCYLAAVVLAGSYGSLVRVAFDLHRHDILKAMAIAVPDNLVEERVLWEALNEWIYNYVPPWESNWPFDPAAYPALPADRFYYDFHQSPPGPAPQQQTVVRVLNVPIASARQEDVPQA